MNQAKPYIAVSVAQNEEKLWDDHFGEAPYFHIYNRHGQLIEKRDNPYWHEDHDVHTGPKKMADLLPECGVFIARAMGEGQKILPKKFGVQPFITTETTVQAALQAYLAQASSVDET